MFYLEELVSIFGEGIVSSKQLKLVQFPIN